MNDLSNRWDSLLEPGEELCWQGRPAPRCYTFRHWKHSVFGLIFFAISLYWQILGIEMAEEYQLFWLALLPIPFLLIGLYFTVGHLLQARLEWEHVYYAVTDRRLLAQRGRKREAVQEMPREKLTYFKLLRQGEELGTLRIHSGTEGLIILHCIEHPQPLVDLLERSIRQNISATDQTAE